MRSKKILWAFVSVGVFALALLVFRIFGIIGAELDVWSRSLAIASSILLCIFIGIAVVEKKLSIRGAVVNLLLTLILVTLSPLVGVIIAVNLHTPVQIAPIVAGCLSGVFALSFLSLFHWLRRKGYFKSTKVDWTDK